MKIIAITQARTGATRFPGKILKRINGKTLLELHLERLKKSSLITDLWVATTDNFQDDVIEELCKTGNINCFRGSTDDVLDRFYQTAKGLKPDYIVRLTSDCPLIDPKLVDNVINMTIDNELDYGANILIEQYPDGQDVEVFTFASLRTAWQKAKKPSEREHVTPFIRNNSDFTGGNLFRALNFESPRPMNHIRMTVDEEADLNCINTLVHHLGSNQSWELYADFIEANPNLFQNQSIIRNEGYLKSLKNDTALNKGSALYKRAKLVIPGGTMLLSKRPEMFLPGKWPSYFSKASGCQIWDIEDNQYLDMSIMGIGTNILGYGHPMVDNAVRKVIDKGNMSTLNCPEEVELAERLVAMHPWSDMVRFARTGGEVNAIAVRIARAASGRDKVAICGYHGWHDWYLSANLGKEDSLDGHLLPGLDPQGVPKNLRNTVLPFQYNHLDELKLLVDENPDIGVIKMEVSRNLSPKTGFLESVRQLASDKNIVLIFDECTSGFRETFGGLHKKYGVDPDMALFGKALGNGYAITAAIGKREIMEAAQKTFISSTFWTERIGPAAALATLEVMEKLHSWEIITETGRKIAKRWEALGKELDLPIDIYGLPALISFRIEAKNWLPYKTYITQEMLKKSILTANSVYVSIAHKPEHLDRYFHELEPILQLIKRCEDGVTDIKELLEGPVCHAGFKRLN